VNLLRTRNRRRKSDVAPTPEELGTHTEALRQALAAGGDRIDPTERRLATSILNKVDERTAIAGGHTVVALAGATGSGKSSLFNQLVGDEVAEVDARRPTTSTPTAAVWGSSPATRLLDWLSVGTRHRVAEPDHADADDAGLPGLVLLDLPDVDSTATDHRAEADRVLELSDIFVWVTDPQKYADARLHDDYIRALAGHAATTLVVFNQADRLTPEHLAACRSDLMRLVSEDGEREAQVLVTSARTGLGVPELRHQIALAVSRRTAAYERLAADIRYAAIRLRKAVADGEPDVEDALDGPLIDALTRAAGIPTVLAAVEKDYRREAWARTGWPFTRWAHALSPDPLKRLRLRPEKLDTGGPGITTADVRAVLGRSSLPPPTPAARAAVDLAARELGERAGAGLPPRWADAAEDAATRPHEDVADALDQAVLRTSLRADKPLWWTIVGLWQGVLAAAAVIGLVWLGALAVMGWLRLPAPRTPMLGPVPYPTLLLVGGLALGFVLGFLGRAAARVGGRRRRDMIAGRLRDAVTEVARVHIVAPVMQVLADHRLTRERLDAASGRSSQA